MDIVDFIEAVQRIDVEKAANETINFTSKELADLNREQLAKGIRADNELVHWLKDGHYPYTKQYATFKANKFGGNTSVVDLNLGKKFIESIKAELKGEEIEFEGTSRMAQYLEPNYSSEIYGLTDDNLEKYTEKTFEPKFFDEIGKQSGLF